MIHLSYSTIKKGYVTLVGNKMRHEGVSETTKIDINEMVEEFLQTMLAQTFDGQERELRFYDEDVNTLYENEVYDIISMAFNSELNLDAAKRLSARLYQNSEYPKFRQGEFFVIELENVLYGNADVNAVALIKINNKPLNLQVEKGEVTIKNSIPLGKIEVGAIILNIDNQNGFVCFSTDTVTKKGERSSWELDFLNVFVSENEYEHTRNWIAFCSEFINSTLKFTFGATTEQIVTAKLQSLILFQEMEVFQTPLLEDIFAAILKTDSESIVGSMAEKIKDYQTMYDVLLRDEFEVSKQAVKEYGRILSATIKLDKNFTISVKGGTTWIEKGMDEEKGKKFIKLYFDQEN